MVLSVVLLEDPRGIISNSSSGVRQGDPEMNPNERRGLAEDQGGFAAYMSYSSVKNELNEDARQRASQLGITL